MPKITKTSARPVKKAKGSIADLISGVEQDDDDGLKFTVYGKSGSGKTVFACTFPKPLLLIRAEKGTKSVKDVKGVSVYPKEDKAKKQRGVMTNADQFDDIIRYIQDTEHEFATIVLDTASALQELVLKRILGLDELPAQSSWGMASREQYGQCTLQMKEYLRALLELPQHVVIIAQERNFNDEGSSDLLMPTVGAALSPSVTGWLGPASDYVGQMHLRRKTTTKKVTLAGKTKTITTDVKGADYCLRVGPDPVYTTKFRKPKAKELPEYIVDPDFDKIMAIIG
jgi:AAA domain